MKKTVCSVFLTVLISLVFLVSCENNVYIDSGENELGEVKFGPVQGVNPHSSVGMPDGVLEVTGPENGKFKFAFTPTTNPEYITVFIGFVYENGSFNQMTRPNDNQFVLEYNSPSESGNYLYIISIGTDYGDTTTREGYLNVNNI